MSTNRDDLGHLMDLAAGLEPDELADVIDLASRYRKGHEGEAAAAVWDRVLADPAAAAKLDALIQAGRDSITRAGAVDGPAAIVALRRKYGLGEAQG